MPTALLAPADVFGMIEVHVEQSIVLDSQAAPGGAGNRNRGYALG